MANAPHTIADDARASRGASEMIPVLRASFHRKQNLKTHPYTRVRRRSTVCVRISVLYAYTGRVGSTSTGTAGNVPLPPVPAQLTIGATLDFRAPLRYAVGTEDGLQVDGLDGWGIGPRHGAALPSEPAYTYVHRAPRARQRGATPAYRTRYLPVYCTNKLKSCVLYTLSSSLHSARAGGASSLD